MGGTTFEEKNACELTCEDREFNDEEHYSDNVEDHKCDQNCSAFVVKSERP